MCNARYVALFYKLSYIYIYIYFHKIDIWDFLKKIEKKINYVYPFLPHSIYIQKFYELSVLQY